jgi:hypothetical protein
MKLTGLHVSASESRASLPAWSTCSKGHGAPTGNRARAAIAVLLIRPACPTRRSSRSSSAARVQSLSQRRNSRRQGAPTGNLNRPRAEAGNRHNRQSLPRRCSAARGQSRREVWARTVQTANGGLAGRLGDDVSDDNSRRRHRAPGDQSPTRSSAPAASAAGRASARIARRTTTNTVQPTQRRGTIATCLLTSATASAWCRAPTRPQR